MRQRITTRVLRGRTIRTLGTVLVARRSPNSGTVAVGAFLVDLACLGVKSAQVRLHKDVDEYRAGLRAHIVRQRPMDSADFNLAAKIIITGLAYAAGLGITPDPVFAQAQPPLAGADPAASDVLVRTGGPGGKPLFINGPYDDVERILAQLRRAVGDGNSHSMLGTGPGSPLLLSDSDLEDDDATRPGG